jgi:hypothetical protein
VIRGSIDASNLIVDGSASNSIYLVFDGLNPKTRYSLVVFFKSNSLQHPSSAQPKSNEYFSYHSLVINDTLETLSRNKSKHQTSVFQLISKKFNEYDDHDQTNSDYELDDDEEEDEEDDYLDEDYDDDYISNDSTKKIDRIINCDLEASSSNKIITINYLSSRMNKLVSFLYKNRTSLLFDSKNKTALNELTTSISNFKDFFKLFQFNKAFEQNYAVYDECIKEFKTNTKLMNKPLCLFNLDAMWESFSWDNNFNNEYFSVQTSINVANSKEKFNSLVYLASACHNRRRPLPTGPSEMRSTAVVKFSLTTPKLTTEIAQRLALNVFLQTNRNNCNIKKFQLNASAYHIELVNESGTKKIISSVSPENVSQVCLF